MMKLNFSAVYKFPRASGGFYIKKRMGLIITSHTNMKRILGFSIYAVLFGLLGLTYKNVADMEGYTIPVLIITTTAAVVTECKAPVFVDNYHEDW